MKCFIYNDLGEVIHSTTSIEEMYQYIKQHDITISENTSDYLTDIEHQLLEQLNNEKAEKRISNKIKNNDNNFWFKQKRNKYK